MTLSDISDVAQGMAAIAVIASLAAVYFQLRQTNLIARANLTQSIWQGAGEFNLALYDTPEKSDLMHRALYGIGTLTDSERLRIENLVIAVMGAHEAAFNAHRRGLMEDGAYMALEHGAGLYLRSPIVQQWWAQGRTRGHDPAYVALMDKIVTENEAKLQARIANRASAS